MKFLKSSWYILLFSAIYYPGTAQDSVQLHPDSGLWNIAMDEVVVTAQHEPTHYTNAVHKVRIIDSKQIQKLGMSNLAEVLTTQLNIQITTDLVLGNGLTMQGISGDNVQIMIDGVPVIGRLDGNIDLSQIQVNNIRRIEIIEGTMSSQFGSNASGGVINLITNSSQVEPFRISTQNRIESRGILDNGISAGWRTGRFMLQGNVRRYHSQLAPVDSLRVMQQVEMDNGELIRVKKHPWNPKLQWSADASIGYHWNDSIKIRYTYRHFDEEVKSYGPVRRPEFKPYAFDDRFNTRRSDHSLTAMGYLTKNLYFSSTQAVNKYDRTLLTLRNDFNNGIQSDVTGSQDTTIFTNILSRNSINYHTPVDLGIQVGLEWQRETAKGNRFGSTPGQSSSSPIQNTAGWISLKYPAGTDWTLQGNIRYGHNSDFDHPVLMSFQSLWKPVSEWSLRAGYSQGFRAPSLKELVFEFIDVNHYILGNRNLKAETSSHYYLNASSGFPLFGRHLTFEAGLFSNDLRNRIVLAEYAPARYTYQNLEKFRTHGVTAEFEFPFTDHIVWESGAGLTFLYNIFSEGTGSQKYYDLLEWKNTLRIHWSRPNVDMVLTQKITGRQQRYQLDDNDDIREGFIDGMNIIHATVSRSFLHDRIHATLGVKNLLNVRSVAAGGTDGGAHSGTTNSRVVHWGRSFFLGFDYRFLIE